MKSYIIVNKDIYLKYKDEILPLNARLFSEPYFYDLKSYNVPLDLKGIENYLSFTNQIIIYTTSSFIDFVNILLVLTFLKEKGYSSEVVINYVFLHQTTLDKAISINNKLTLQQYNEVDHILECIKENKPMPNINFPIIGYINFSNFYNMLIDHNKFMMCFEEIIEEYEEDAEDIANYLFEKYSNFGLSKEFYLDYLTKYLWGSYVWKLR